MHRYFRFRMLRLEAHHTASPKTGTVLAVLLVLAVINPVLAFAGDCPERQFPLALSQELLIDGKAEAELLSRLHRAEQCKGLAEDLAQLYFWGSERTVADLDRSWQFARAARRGDGAGWPAQLRLLVPVYTLAGLKTDQSIGGATLSLQRELAEPGLRRDKAIAALSQLEKLSAKLQGPLGNELDRLRTRPHQIWRQESFQSGRLVVGFRLATGGSYLGQCTASLLAERWLLTAAHCLLAPPEKGPAVLEYLRFQSFKAGREVGEDAAIVEAWQHSRFSSDARLVGDIERYSGADLALLKTDRPLAGLAAELAVAENATLRLRTSGFPRDEQRGSYWQVDCVASRVAGKRGRESTDIQPIFTLACANRAGQSGSLVTDDTGRGLGVLSANLTEQQLTQSIAVMFSDRLLADMSKLMAGAQESTFFRRLDLTRLRPANNTVKSVQPEEG